MKRKALKRVTLLVLGFIFLVSPIAFAGDYDGVWWNPDVLPNTLVMLRQVGGTIAGVAFELSADSPPTVLVGTFDENTAQGQMSSAALTPFLDLSLTTTFTSTTEGTVTVTSCSPASECAGLLLFRNIPIPVSKVF